MSKSPYRNSTNTIRVAVVEDHTLVRQSLVYLLKKEPQIIVTLQAENGRDFLNKLPEHQIDIVLLDLDMPVLNGLETLKILRSDYPSIQVIILSMHADEWIVAEMIREGAKSFLLKDCSINDMLDALFNVQFKGSHTSEIVEKAFFNQQDKQLASQISSVKFDLTTRDHLILKLICDGKSSEEIADRMFLSKKTIDANRSQLLKKIEAKNTAELIRKSICLGLYSARTDEEIKTEDLIASERRKQ
jgi:two-component system, NarL family, response regulator DegU